MIKVVIAEDHQALIDGVTSYFENHKKIKFIGSATNGEDLVAIVNKLKPNVVITDIRMPIMDGFEATRLIKKRYKKSIHVLAFTMFDQADAVNRMMNAGAIGYILKNSGLKILIKAIESVAKGEQYFDPNVLISIENDKKNKNATQEKGILTNREKEILAFIAEGKKSIEIADELCLSRYTIDTHRKNMNRKLGLKTHADLMKYAVERKYKF